MRRSGDRMKSLFAAFFCAVFSTAAGARPYEDIIAEAQTAFSTEDFALAAVLLDEAQISRPYSLFLSRNRVLARILSGKVDEAIAITKEIADRGIVLELPSNDAFDRMRADPQFSPIADQMAKNALPKGAASIVAEYAEDGLLPEAISKSRKRLLIGSVRTGEILIAGDRLAGFTKLGGGVFDIEQRKGGIFAAVNNQLAYKGDKDPAKAAIVILDPASAAEIGRYSLGPGPALIGDIEISKKGRIFASDSLTPRIFEITLQKSSEDQSAGSVAEFRDDRFVNLQGLALDEKSSRLFIADYLTGLYMLDLKSGTIHAINNPGGAHLGGIDGLYFYNGDLVGIQNGASPQRIVRIHLDISGLTAISLDVLQQALPEWSEPTHGYIDDGAFFYIAASNWPAYDDDGIQRDNAELTPLRIMKIPLN